MAREGDVCGYREARVRTCRPDEYGNVCDQVADDDCARDEHDATEGRGMAARCAVVRRLDLRDETEESKGGEGEKDHWQQ